MKSYAEIKKIILENRTTLILGIGYLLVFLLGFGTGRYDQEWQKHVQRLQNNYNTKFDNLQKETQAIPAEEGTLPAKSFQTASSGPCIIKGNISSQGRKLYHMPGGSFYERVNPEQCFATEGEAQAAGFTKSSR